MKKTFGEHLRDLREARKLTLRDIEEMSGISNAYLSQVESGTRGTPTVPVLRRLAGALGMRMTELLDYSMPEDDEHEIRRYTAEQRGIRARTGSVLGRQNMNARPELGRRMVPVSALYIYRTYKQLSDESKKSLYDFLRFLMMQDRRKKFLRNRVIRPRTSLRDDDTRG
jgi:transcriptional regulator with XRE-family HTH domain